MLFYPIVYKAIVLYRAKDTHYGIIGWQGVVPSKTEMMAGRLVTVVTSRLLSLVEAFERLDTTQLARLLMPGVAEAIHRDCGPVWSALLQRVLPILLTRIIAALKLEINDVLDFQN